MRAIERRTGLAVLVAALIFALVWGALTVSTRRTLQTSTPGIDFYVMWLAGRAYFDHHNPYAPEVDRQIQDAIFGGPPAPGQDPMEFEYPAFVLLPLAPFIGMPFDWAQAAWMSLILLVLVLAAYSLVPRVERRLWMVFPFFYPITFGVILGNITIAIFLLLAITWRRVVEAERPPVPVQVILGAALAWSTAKPQFVWLALGLILLIGLRRRLWPFLGAFAGGLAGLLALSLVFLPAWPLLWWEQMRSYSSYSTILLSRYLAYLLPQGAVGAVSTLGLAALAAATGWILWRWWQGRVSDLLALGWCALVTFLVDLSIVAYEQAIFLLPVFLWAGRQRPSPALRAAWVAAMVLSYVLFALDYQKILPGASDELPFLLYAAWLGWFATRPARARVAGAPRTPLLIGDL